MHETTTPRQRRKPAPKDWHPEDIKAAVRKTGISLDALSRASDLPDHSCRRALYEPAMAGEEAIAARLGVPARQIWPSRFDSEGRRLSMPRPLRSSPKSSSVRTDVHRQKTGAA